MHAVLRDYLERRSATASIDRENKSLLEVSTWLHTDRRLSGVIETGEWGFTSELRDVENGHVTHQRAEGEAEVLPFYFLMELPAAANEGILILQRLGSKGIRSLLSSDMTSFVEGLTTDYRISIAPLAPTKLVDQYLHGNGVVKQVKLVKFSIPDDIATVFRDRDHAEQSIYLELSVKAKRRRSIPILGRVQEVLNGTRDLGQLVEIQDFAPDIVKVEVSVNGKARTINLARPNSLRAYFDITDRVILVGGHPTRDSIEVIALELLEDFAQVLWVEDTNA